MCLTGSSPGACTIFKLLVLMKHMKQSPNFDIYIYTYILNFIYIFCWNPGPSTQALRLPRQLPKPLHLKRRVSISELCEAAERHIWTWGNSASGLRTSPKGPEEGCGPAKTGLPGDVFLFFLTVLSKFPVIM